MEETVDVIVLTSGSDTDDNGDVPLNSDYVQSDNDSDNSESILLPISPAKKVFTPTKRLRSSPSSDESESDDFGEGESKDTLFLKSEDEFVHANETVSNSAEHQCTSREVDDLFFKGDRHLPIYASPDSGYPLHLLIDILLKPNMPPEHVCAVQPLGVSQNALFIIDIDVVNFEDLKADDLGSWKGTGTKKLYFRVSLTGAIKYSEAKPNTSSSQYLQLTRRYYVHKGYAEYHRMIADVQNHSGQRNKYAIVQYWFDGPPIEVKVKPHGNALCNTPFFCTAESAKRRHQEIARTNKPSEALQKATQDGGGELGATGMQKLPRNIQQMKNYRRTGHTKDHNVLYSVMLQCKLTEGTSDAFVRDVKAAPDPQCVMMFDFQLQDLVRFLTDSRKFSIFTADTTYNVGNFYVTPTTYKHLMLVDTTSKKHPTMAGPFLVHQRKNFAAFNYFASTLICFNKKLQQIQAFGTDGDEALVEAFTHNFPFAIQLRCFLHVKRNILSKLKDRGIPSSVSEEFISDMFGKRIGDRYEEGLVDSTSVADFHTRLQNCEETWNARELSYQRPGQASFFEYFVHTYSSIFEHTMLRNIRTDVGLGFPPDIFTTNSSESLNAVIKKRLNYKESEWPEFNEAMKQLVLAQRDEVIRALSGRGQYQLDREYAHLIVSPQQWIRMKPEQRKELIKQFDSMKIKCHSGVITPPVTVQPQMPQTSLPRLPSEEGIQLINHMSISAANSNILTLPKVTLEAMWDKANEYLQSKVDVVTAPGNDPKAKMVSSRSGSLPHFVQVVSPGHYICDKHCLQWTSSQICSHTLVAAEINGELRLFLQWYTSSDLQPNITQLAMAGLPKGRGRKGGVPKRKRLRTPAATPSVVVSRSATQHTPNLSLGDNSSSSSPIGDSNPHPLSDHCLPSSHRQASVNVTNFSPYLQSTQIGNSTANLSISQSLDITTSSSMLGHSQHPIHLGGVSMSPSVSTPVAVPNTNPFYVKAIEGNIRVCQGCRGSLKGLNGSVPAPPFDMCSARSERRSFRDANGILRTPSKEQACHYHLNLTCIRAVASEFIPSSLRVPPDVLPRLTNVHKEYLRLVFNLSF